MKQRVITGLILVAIVLPPLYLGGYYFLALAFAFFEIAVNEIINMMGKKWPAFFRYSLYLLALGIILCARLDVKYLVVSLAAMAVYFFVVSEFNENFPLNDIGILFVYFSIISMMMAGLFGMYAVNNLLVIFMGIATACTDMFALFTGMMFGKHKFNERISPKKTIEGCIGGYLFGAVLSFLFGHFLINNVPSALIISGSLLMPLIGQFGDLAFSEIKRHFGIKDFGKIFPGHGGVNDRIDSISFNCMVMYALMLIFL